MHCPLLERAVIEVSSLQYKFYRKEEKKIRVEYAAYNKFSDLKKDFQSNSYAFFIGARQYDLYLYYHASETNRELQITSNSDSGKEILRILHA